MRGEGITYPYSCNIMVLSNPVAFSRMVLTLSWKSWLGGGNVRSLAYLLRKRSSRTFSLSMTDGMAERNAVTVYWRSTDESTKELERKWWLLAVVWCVALTTFRTFHRVCWTWGPGSKKGMSLPHVERRFLQTFVWSRRAPSCVRKKNLPHQKRGHKRKTSEGKNTIVFQHRSSVGFRK